MLVKKIRKLLLLFAAFSLFAAACGSDDDDAQDDPPDVTEAAFDDGNEDDANEEEMDDMSDTPGEGVSITPARADWSTGYFQNEVIAQLLRELGYDVAEPSELELSAPNAFLGIAEGDIDYWANSWLPGHRQLWQSETSDGSLIADHISPVGELMIGGTYQGLVIEKTFADEFDIKSVDDFNNNPDAIAAYDAVDPMPGNGIADIFGCAESWVCDDVIAAQIDYNEWENINQIIAGYEAMLVEAVDRVDSQTPAIIYTWGPSAHSAKLRPSDNIYWLTQDNVIPDDYQGVIDSTIPSQGTGVSSFDAESCPGVVNHPDGLCQIGFLANDIQVAANNDFLAANPVAEALLAAVVLPVFDVTTAVVAQDIDGEDPSELAAEWIAANRETADEWLHKARQAA